MKNRLDSTKVSMLLLVYAILATVLLNSTAKACDYYYYHGFAREDWVKTVLVVSDGGSRNIRVNARKYPDIDAPVLGVFSGGTELTAVDFFYTNDGRIWAEMYSPYDGYVYISCRYLQPAEGGSFFYLSTDADVRDAPYYCSDAIGEFEGDQIILVSEIIFNDNDYWAKVLANGQFGYIQLVLLDAMG